MPMELSAIRHVRASRTKRSAGYRGVSAVSHVKETAQMIIGGTHSYAAA